MNTAIDAGEREAQKYSLALLTTEEFHQFWPHISRMLDQVPHTWRHWTKEWIVEAVEAGMLQVWGIGPPPKAILVLITQVATYPAIKSFNVVWAAGTFKRDMSDQLYETFMNFARLHSCTVMEIRGRKGWHPFLKAKGFKREAEVWSHIVHHMRDN